MDPNCAICSAPATLACDCEAKGLELAVRQAEDRMMRSIYSDIRAHAQDYVLEYFRLLAERRKTAHTVHLDQMAAHAFYHYNAPPHPNQIADAQAALKRGIDEDWQASVQRYPEVLEYYFGLVELTLPADDEQAVKDPPLSALNGHHHRKAARRSINTTNNNNNNNSSSSSSNNNNNNNNNNNPPAPPPPPPPPLPEAVVSSSSGSNPSSQTSPFAPLLPPDRDMPMERRAALPLRRDRRARIPATSSYAHFP
ncbi:hypothetical protein L249_8043 [Ophiocordyceps polyrhachis-furcata BCC 54312]|uniref:Uncharacterized protein n=1 Tax=Ophiocordyceps polyrhachis-furcata BCC 54312 TaxID=1330021 RepID=A0A367LHX6_9HYPO|nr:hypothetical protein L249_8043 [Ophiocordyceps polyrhachis-furcata BCC 54312]